MRHAMTKTHRTSAASLRADGFTLIEVMIVVAIVAILAAIAIPLYQDSVRKSRRVAMQATLQEIGNRQQQYLMDAREYAGTAALLNFTVPADQLTWYNVGIVAVPASPLGAASFTVTATPQGSQASEACGVMTLDNRGSKTAAKPGCW